MEDGPTVLEGRGVEMSHNWIGEVWDWPLQHNDGIVKVINTHEKFEVSLDCQFFTPKEVEVKICGEELMIYCRHELREDIHGSIAREIHRCYRLPHDIDAKQLKCHLTQGGVLQISAPKRRN